MKEFESVAQNQSSLVEVNESLISFPYEISFPDSDSSAGTREKIENHLAKLERYFDRITYAKVFVRIPHKHRGLRFFHIHIQLDVPGRQLAVSREPEANEDHAELSVAIAEAFEKITRQLEDYKKSMQSH